MMLLSGRQLNEYRLTSDAKFVLDVVLSQLTK